MQGHSIVEKDLRTLLSLFTIARNFSEWKLVFAGNGEIETGGKLVSLLEIENQVIFRGWVSGKIKEQLF
jgi:hypothetical protein